MISSLLASLRIYEAQIFLLWSCIILDTSSTCIERDTSCRVIAVLCIQD